MYCYIINCKTGWDRCQDLQKGKVSLYLFFVLLFMPNSDVVLMLNNGVV